MTTLAKMKCLIPFGFVAKYHYCLAWLAAVWYRFPANQMIVIGVTGTSGKSSTVQYIYDLLRALNQSVGYTSTIGFAINGEYEENKSKMTMLGRFFLSGMLRKMVSSGCQYAVIETSSQGISQHRHQCINYDLLVFTNLSPEHIEAHGGYINYRAAKGKLFSHLAHSPIKIFNGKTLEKIVVLNGDDREVEFFSSFPVKKIVKFGWGSGQLDIQAQSVGANITVNHHPVHWQLPAEFSRKNALAAVATVTALGFPLQEVLVASEKLGSVPGRFQFIFAGQPFIVIIDYAFEPGALTALFKAVHSLHPVAIIGVHGSAGGGRDLARRKMIGEIAGKEERLVVVTNEDPYDDNPEDIIKDVAAGAQAVGKRVGVDLKLILDRATAIKVAIHAALPGEAVIITGKGSEPVMAVANGQKIPWSDAQAALNALADLGYTV